MKMEVIMYNEDFIMFLLSVIVIAVVVTFIIFALSLYALWRCEKRPGQTLDRLFGPATVNHEARLKREQAAMQKEQTDALEAMLREAVKYPQESRRACRK